MADRWRERNVWYPGKAVRKDTDMYLETVETAKDAKTEADRTGAFMI